MAKNVIGKILLFAIILIIAVFLFLYKTRLLQNKFVFQPSIQHVRAADVPSDKEEVYFRNSNLIKYSNPTVHGWFFPSPSRDKRVIAFFHGNAHNISSRGSMINFLRKLGPSVLIFDYSGYGKSSDNGMIKPDEDTTLADGIGAYEYLIKRGYKQKDIILFGRSLGGSVAISTAAKRPCSNLVLMSTFASIDDLIHPILRPLCGMFTSLESMKDVDCPVLFIHSNSDQLVPKSSGRKLYSATRTRKAFVEVNGTHNNISLDDDLLTVIDDFI